MKGEFPDLGGGGGGFLMSSKMNAGEAGNLETSTGEDQKRASKFYSLKTIDQERNSWKQHSFRRQSFYSLKKKKHRKNSAQPQPQTVELLDFLQHQIMLRKPDYTPNLADAV